MSIDTGADLSHYLISSHVKEQNSFNYNDLNGHGTHIAGIILENVCKEVEFISCKYYEKDQTADDRMSLVLYCFKKAELLKVDIINFSSSGNEFYSKEFKLIQNLSNRNVKIIVATGNEGLDLKKNPRYPSCYNVKNLIPVGNLIDDKTINPNSNYGLDNMVWEIGTSVISTLPDKKWGIMTGTSQSTARHTNKLLKEKCNDLRLKIR